MTPFLAPAEYIDSDHRAIRACADRLASDLPAVTAIAIFDFVRDLVYEGDDFEDLEIYRASHVLQAGHGYCVSKASLAAALARASGIPARVAFADVRNHLASDRLREAMGTDLFAWHGYVELLLDERWVRVSPTFDPETCWRAGVEVLTFDGVHDALLQAFDGATTMDYVRHHGSFHDVPARFLSAEMLRLYPFARDHGISRSRPPTKGGPTLGAWRIADPVTGCSYSAWTRTGSPGRGIPSRSPTPSRPAWLPSPTTASA